MITDSTGEALGMDAMLPFFQKLPMAPLLFHNFLFPGFALLIVIGLTNLSAFLLLWKRNPWGSRAGLCCGVILMLWICIQFYIFPLNLMSTIYFVFGVLQALTGRALRRKESLAQLR